MTSIQEIQAEVNRVANLGLAASNITRGETLDDGSVELVCNGKVVAWQRPDGTAVLKANLKYITLDVIMSEE